MKVLILLAGAGLGDGSAIEEVVLTYTILDKYQIEYIPISENREFIPIDHFRSVNEEPRNLLIESARIGRGIIKDLANIRAEDYDLILIQGGNGLMANLGESLKARDLVLTFYESSRPIATMCAGIDYLRNIIDKDIFKGKDEEFKVEGSYYDENYRIFYTPAFRKGSNLYKIEQGIENMIKDIIDSR